MKARQRNQKYQAKVDARIQEKQSDARSDLELVTAINGGETVAFESLYFRYRDWVVGLAYRFTEDEAQAMDVLQETFLYVLKKFPGFSLTSTFKTFLYPAVKHVAIAARKKAQRYQSTEMEMARAENIPAVTETSSSIELLQVLKRLSEEHREVLLLRFVDGLNLTEIAQALDIPLGTVKSRLHNALGMLRADPKTREYFE